MITHSIAQVMVEYDIVQFKGKGRGYACTKYEGFIR